MSAACLDTKRGSPSAVIRGQGYKASGVGLGAEMLMDEIGMKPEKEGGDRDREKLRDGERQRGGAECARWVRSHNPPGEGCAGRLQDVHTTLCELTLQTLGAQDRHL